MKHTALLTSRNNLIAISVFLPLLVFYRFVLPYGDEPDFIYRMFHLLNDEFTYWNPYFYFQGLLNQFNWWSVSEDFYQKILRLIITLFILTPLLTCIVFKNLIFELVNNLKSITIFENWNTSIAALSLSLIFPSIIYYVGVFAEEQFTLILSLFIFIFISYPLIVLLLIILIGLVDFGNSIVVIAFLLLCYTNRYLLSKFGIQSVIYSCLSIIAVSFLLGLDALTYLVNLPYIGEKAALIYNDYTNIYTDIAGKYPSFFRPVITVITGIFWLPSNFLAVYLYPFYFYYLYRIISLSFVYNVKKNKLRTFLELESYVFFISGMTIIVSFPLIMNGFSTAKYYVFILPFIMKEAVRIFKFSSIFYTLIISNILIIIQLFFYSPTYT